MARSRRQRLESAAFAVLATLAVAMVGFFLAVLVGVVPVSEPRDAVTAEAAAPAASEAAAAPPTTEPAQTTTAAAAPAASSPRKRALAVVTLVASRGDCWVVARRGGPDGAVLHEALVPAGERLTFRAPRVWLQLGAAANVDVVVDGDPVPIGAGTVEVVVPGPSA